MTQATSSPNKTQTTATQQATRPYLMPAMSWGVNAIISNSIHVGCHPYPANPFNNTDLRMKERAKRRHDVDSSSTTSSGRKLFFVLLLATKLSNLLLLGACCLLLSRFNHNLRCWHNNSPSLQTADYNRHYSGTGRVKLLRVLTLNVVDYIYAY